MAKRNSEALISKITAVYQARDISASLADSAASASTKGKLFLVEKLTQLMPALNDIKAGGGVSPSKKSPQKNSANLRLFIDSIFPAVYKLLDEYLAGRGRNITADLKQGIDRLVKAVFDI